MAERELAKKARVEYNRWKYTQSGKNQRKDEKEALKHFGRHA